MPIRSNVLETEARTRPRVVAEAEVPTPEVVDLPLRVLKASPSLRAAGLDAAHITTLAELAPSWPPIVVRRADHSVIDGQHRIAAAARLGLTTLPAVMFDGTADDAYVEFVRCNVGHGLPLSLDERRAAVARILRTHPERSDRSIAALCGVSPKTVARVRDERAVHQASRRPPAAIKGRVGRDGRVRPVDPEAVRTRIAEELARRPEASLRAIAQVVGASPETVRSVKNKLRTGDSVASRRVTVDRVPEATVLGLLSRKQRCERPWQDDRALAARDGGARFVEWFDATAVDSVDGWEHAGVVPLSRVYEVADEARRRAAFWLRFAETLEGQVRRRA
jgi:ParB-like chromosome segregation protein Spo0J